jgi:hypothetical protein
MTIVGRQMEKRRLHFLITMRAWNTLSSPSFETFLYDNGKTLSQSEIKFIHLIQVKMLRQPILGYQTLSGLAAYVSKMKQLTKILAAKLTKIQKT